MANVNDIASGPTRGRDFHHTKSSEIKKEEKKDEDEKSKKSKKKGSYVGKTGEVYGFFQKEYQTKRGIAFNVGGGVLVITKSKDNEKEKEKKIQAEIEARGKLLVDFWEQIFIKSKTATYKPNASISKLSDTKKSEESNLRERIQLYYKDEITFTINEDIEKEIKEMIKQEEELKKSEKNEKEAKSLDDLKRLLQKGLDLKYGFDRENQEE